MKSLNNYINEQLIFELSSELLTRAAHAAVDKGDTKKVMVFLKGAKAAKNREDKQKAKEFIDFQSFINMSDKLNAIFEKYGNKMCKRGWQKYVKQWITHSGGSSYEGTDYFISASYGILMNDDFMNKMLKPEFCKDNYKKYFSIRDEYEKEVNDLVQKFYTEHPNPNFNFITQYKTNEEAKEGNNTWMVEGDRSKFCVMLGLPDKPHPYSGGDQIFGIVSHVTPGDVQTSSNGGGLGMPAVYITQGPKHALARILNKYSE